MKNNSPDNYGRRDECAHEFWLAALFIAGLMGAIVYLLIITFSRNALLLIGVILIIPVALYPKLENTEIGSFIQSFGSFLLAIGIACLWAGYLRGLPKF